MAGGQKKPGYIGYYVYYYKMRLLFKLKAYVKQTEDTVHLIVSSKCTLFQDITNFNFKKRNIYIYDSTILKLKNIQRLPFE